MIDKNTILSVYTEKQTLLEYLTAIEKALDNAVLVSADIVDEGSNKCHFVFTFEDDTKIITPTIEFVKPVKGATIRNGVLYLTLADGTEVSAGSITASFGATTFDGDVIVHGNLQLNGNQTEVGNVSITGDSSVSGTFTSKNVNATGNCDASTFGKQLGVSAGSDDANVTATLDEISVTPHVSKVGYGIHAHFQLMLVVGSAYVAPGWMKIAHIEGGGLQSAYQGKLLMSESRFVILAGGGTLATYGWGIDANGRSGNLYISGSALTAGKTYYIDFNQTINY